MSTDREKALELALAQIDKQHGKGSIMRMGEKGTMAIEASKTSAPPRKTPRLPAFPALPPLPSATDRILNSRVNVDSR